MDGWLMAGVTPAWARAGGRVLDVRGRLQLVRSGHAVAGSATGLVSASAARAARITMSISAEVTP